MSRKSLRKTVKKNLPRNRVMTRLNRLMEPPVDFQSAIITMTAMIDLGLEVHILARFRKLSQSDRDAIFSGTGSLAGLSSKIRTAYALGIIGQKTRQDLSTINQVRNILAHTPMQITFNNRAVRSAIEGLHLQQASNRHQSSFKSPRTVTKSDQQQAILATVATYVLMLNWDKPPRRPYIARRSTIFKVLRATLHL
jgi:DNA-binding MltR family transcriptional regulator